MQQEMVSLERRITSLEDDEIEVMERAEEAQRTLDSLTAQLTDTDAEIADLTAKRDARLAEIDQALGELDGQRGPIVADLPADLLALYDRLRESKGGVGAALLRARRCAGCNLDLDHAEVATIRAAADDEVIRCDDCSRILVRTVRVGSVSRPSRSSGSSSRPTAARAATPAPRRTARWSRTPTPAGCSPRRAPRSGSPATTWRSTAD